MAYLSEQDSALLTALKNEEDGSATYLQSEVEAAQVEALARYFGDKYGDEVEGRSSITTREIFEQVEWMRPELARMFTSGDRIVDIQPVTPQDDQYAQAATDYINWLFLEQQQGAKLLDQLAFDGLLQRVGVMATVWKDAEYESPQEITGLNSLQAQQLMQDPATQIEAHEPRMDTPDEAHPDGMYHDFVVRRRKSEGRPDIFVVAPEDFRISARAASLEDCTYCGDILRLLKGEAKRLYPDYAEEIDAAQPVGQAWNVDDRRSARFRDVDGWSEDRNRVGEGAVIEIMREFIRYDYNGDGYPEWVMVYRLNDCFLEPPQEVDDHIYAAWTPIPVAHRFYGLSIADVAGDLQRAKTALLRAMLDAVYQAAVPRIAADENGVNLNDLLSVRPGAVVRTKGPPGDKLMPVQVPDLSGPALNAMQWLDQVLETRTGVSRHSQGLDPDALNHTARGIQLLQNATAMRKEQVARNFGWGLEAFFRKLYRLIVRRQDEARAVKISGQWRNVDPRQWSADMRVSISTGLGTGSREQQIAMLQMLQADQMAWVGQYGAATPIVTARHLYRMVEQKARVMGFRTAEPFFSEPPEGWAPQPAPDPSAGKAQADAQAKQAELQMRAQEAQAKLSLETQRTQAQLQLEERRAGAQMDADDRRAAAQIESDERKASAQIQLDAQKLEADLALKREQMRVEYELKLQQMQMEFSLKERQMQMEAQIKREVGLANAKAKAKGAMNGTGPSSDISEGDVRFGGDVG